MKTIPFEANAYRGDSIGQPMVLEKVKVFNYDEEFLSDGQKIYNEAEYLYMGTGTKRCEAINFGGKDRDRDLALTHFFNNNLPVPFFVFLQAKIFWEWERLKS